MSPQDLHQLVEAIGRALRYSPRWVRRNWAKAKRREMLRARPQTSGRTKVSAFTPRFVAARFRSRRP